MHHRKVQNIKNVKCYVTFYRKYYTTRPCFSVTLCNKTSTPTHPYQQYVVIEYSLTITKYQNGFLLFLYTCIDSDSYLLQFLILIGLLLLNITGWQTSMHQPYHAGNDDVTPTVSHGKYEKPYLQFSENCNIQTCHDGDQHALTLSGR